MINFSYPSEYISWLLAHTDLTIIYFPAWSLLREVKWVKCCGHKTVWWLLKIISLPNLPPQTQNNYTYLGKLKEVWLSCYLHLWTFFKLRGSCPVLTIGRIKVMYFQRNQSLWRCMVKRKPELHRLLNMLQLLSHWGALGWV